MVKYSSSCERNKATLGVEGIGLRILILGPRLALCPGHFTPAVRTLVTH